MHNNELIHAEQLKYWFRLRAGWLTRRRPRHAPWWLWAHRQIVSWL